MKNTLLYTLILVVVVMLVVDVVVMFMSKRPYEVVHYEAVYEYGFTDEGTFTTTTRVVFRKEKYLDKYVETLKKGATDVIDKYFNDLGEKLKRNLKVLSYKYNTKKVDPLTLEINEVLHLKGAVLIKHEGGRSVYEASLGDVKINSVGDSTVEVVLPKNAKIISVDPKESERVSKKDSTVLIWKNGSLKTFPKVVYEKGE